MNNSYTDILVSWIENICSMFRRIHPSILFSGCRSIKNSKILSEVYPWINRSIYLLIGVFSMRINMTEVIMGFHIFSTSLCKRIKIGILSQEGLAIGETRTISKNDDILNGNGINVGIIGYMGFMYRNSAPVETGSDHKSQYISGGIHFLGESKTTTPHWLSLITKIA